MANPRLGDIVELLTPCLGNEPGTRGIVFHVFDNNVAQVIFPNGEYDGFDWSTDVDTWFKIHTNLPLVYDFTNVMQLRKDFKDGIFTKTLELYN